MKKILIIGMSDNLGGVEKFIINYVTNMNLELCSFDYLMTAKECKFKEEIEKNNGKIINISISHSINPKKFKTEVLKIMYENNYDVVWLNDCSLNSIHYLKYAKIANINKRIIHSHNSKFMDNTIKGKIRHIIHIFNKTLIKRYATDFWACSRKAANFFYNKSIINSSKFLIVNNAIDLEKYKFDIVQRKNIRKELKIKEDEIVTINIGRFHKQKNHKFLIKLFSEIVKSNPKSKLLLVGDGTLKEKIKSEIKKLDIEQNVMLLGIRKDIEILLQGADILMLPSLFEGLPIVGIEAQMSGIPCLFSDRITKECNILNNNKYINIAKKDIWKSEYDKVCKNLRNYSREDTYLKMVDAGFDIKTEALKIQKYLLN